jgi:potassium voltage-gated channel delayed-rectifier subfamily S protein 2
LHLINDICILAFYDDLVYWGIDEFYFETCCLVKYFQKKDEANLEIRRTGSILASNQENFGKCLPSLKKKIWNLMENPETSILAKVKITNFF